MSSREAQLLAKEQGVDLVEIAANANPPVVKIIDWGKFQYQKMKEEAKKVLKEHPDWSNDYVAQHCGFSSRTYFQKKFKAKNLKKLRKVPYQAIVDSTQGLFWPVV